MSTTGLKKPSLFSAIALGVGSIIGSGWLFASYNAAKFAGPIAILSWVFGAIIALLIALLLAEIATMFHKEKSLFSRLLAISHNRDYGFIIAISNWCSMVVAIPAEAEATMQYLSEILPQFHNKIFLNDEFTALGLVFVCFIIIIYGTLNYWGVMLLTKANNAITMKPLQYRLKIYSYKFLVNFLCYFSKISIFN
jgi:amino acid transporter